MLLSFLFPLAFASVIGTSTSTINVQLANEQAISLASSTFAGTPMMKVAMCESGLRQYGEDGSALLGKVDQDDTGFFQLNKKYHLEAARKMGYDIESSYGNIMYAKWLYENQGIKPWSASNNCHHLIDKS